MQNTFDFYLNGLLVPAPDNWQNFQAELSFENLSPESVFNATKLTWKGNNAATINAFFKAGLTGGVGIFEGIPLVIKVCSTGDILFNGICDLTDPDTKFVCDKVTVRIRDMRMDMVTELFSSISYAYLATPVSKGGAGIISSTDYIAIPYQVNNVPDYFEFMTSVLAIYQIVEQCEKIIEEIIGFLTGITASSALVGWGGVVAETVNAIFWIIELAFMVIIVINLIQMAADNIVAPVYNKYGMNVYTLMSKACQYFGLQFQSTILQNAPYNNLVIMPTKGAWANQSTDPTLIQTFFSTFSGGFAAKNRLMYDDVYNLSHNGFAYGYYDGTVASLFESMSIACNAKAKIIINSKGQPVLHFERWDYQYNLSSYQLPNISDEAPFPQSYGTNAGELASNYLVEYSLDSNDYNTVNTYDGTTCYAQFSPIKINNSYNVTLKNLTRKTIPFSQGLRKTQLTTAEQLLQNVFNVAGGVVNVFIAIINGVISALNWIFGLIGVGSVSFIPTLSGTLFGSTIGILQLSNNVTGTPKLLLTVSNTDGHLDPTNRTSSDPIAARNLMKNFHFSSLIITTTPSTALLAAPYTPSTTYFNQYLTYFDQDIPMCCADYELIKNNNIITTYTGDQARVDTLKWTIFHSRAKINYRVRKQYTKNVQASYCIDGTTFTTTL